MLAIAGMIFRFVRELRRTKHGCADWLGCARQVGRGDGFGRVLPSRSCCSITIFTASLTAGLAMISVITYPLP